MLVRNRISNEIRQAVSNQWLYGSGVFYVPLQQQKTDRTHGVLTDVLLGLELGDLHFCNGDHSHLYKNARSSH
jgi:hypothetical protein